MAISWNITLTNQEFDNYYIVEESDGEMTVYPNTILGLTRLLEHISLEPRSSKDREVIYVVTGHGLRYYFEEVDEGMRAVANEWEKQISDNN